MPRDPRDTVRNQFISFQAGISETFTTRDARDWYRKNRGTGFYGNLFKMVLQPLSKEGRILKISRGLWRIINLKEELNEQSILKTHTWQKAVEIPRSEADKTRQAILRDLDTDDEFEAYIASKLKGA